MRQWQVLRASSTDKRRRRLLAVLPRNRWLSNLLSADDRAVLFKEFGETDIPFSRLDVIISVTGDAVAVHVDGNAPGSVQSTSTLGRYSGAAYTAFGGVRKKRRMKK